ncbi:MAG: DUF523 domain-containing protein [Syntrophotaleaceae bacterium]
MPRPILVSACLLGLATRYDGGTKSNSRCLEFLRSNDLIPIPVCPEQLAGLPTPRLQSSFCTGTGSDVLDGTGSLLLADGREVTVPFVRGAEETLKVCRLTGCREALFKERSPSCGVRQVYLGERIVSGQGVTTALLLRHGVRILSEEDLQSRRQP